MTKTSARYALSVARDTGWAITQIDSSNPHKHRAELLDLAQALGTVTATRGTSAIDLLRPLSQAEARPSSMSSVFGLGIQPWHMDMAHRPSPARFVLLSCIRPGIGECTTDLLDWRKLLDTQDKETAMDEPVLVRSGRSSFYSTMLDKRRQFLRQDPACISALSGRGRDLQTKIGRATIGCVHSTRWTPGLTLIFDNWRLLHRRADAALSIDRALLRVSIMDSHNEQ